MSCQRSQAFPSPRVCACRVDATRLTKHLVFPRRAHCSNAPPPQTLDSRGHCSRRESSTMPSYEAKLLADFLVAPASLRDFMTPRQFASIFPSAHRSNPAIQELYRELHTLRERDIDAVRQDIADEVRRSKPLKREYAHERRQMDAANVTGLDPVALQMEQEVIICCFRLSTIYAYACSSCPALATQETRNRTRCRRCTPVLVTPVRASSPRSQTWSRRHGAHWARSKRPLVP